MLSQTSTGIPIGPKALPFLVRPISVQPLMSPCVVQSIAKACNRVLFHRLAAYRKTGIATLSSSIHYFNENKNSDSATEINYIELYKKKTAPGFKLII